MSSGTRPNPLGQFLSDRGVRLAAGLAVVVAIPVAVLFYFQFRSLNDLEATSAVVLRQLSSDTADSLRQGHRRVPQAAAHQRAAPHPAGADRAARPRVDRSDLQRWPGRKSVHRRRSTSGPTSGRGLAVAGWCSTGQPRHPRRGRPSAFARIPRSATACCRNCASWSSCGARSSPSSDDRRRQALHPGAAALGVAGARTHDQRGGVRGGRRTASRRSSFPSLLRDWLAQLQQPIGLPGAARLTSWTRPASTSPCPRRAHGECAVDERSSRSSSSTRSCSSSPRPTKQHREIWRLRTSYGTQTIPAIVSASTRPQRALMSCWRW